jgi:hypothetical protein
MLKNFENLQHKIDFKLEIKKYFKKASYLMKSHYMFFMWILKHLHGNTTIRYEGLNMM